MFPCLNENVASAFRRHPLAVLALMFAVLISMNSGYGIAATARASEDSTTSEASSPEDSLKTNAESKDADPEFFSRVVRPLLENHCFACHGNDQQEGALRLDTLSGINQGGKSGGVLVPGKSAESLLITAIRHTDETLKMPPDEKLSPETTELIARWIDSGALHPDGVIIDRSALPPFDVEEAREFWAFQPIRRPSVPAVKATERIAGPIDAFIVAALESNGLELNPQADKLTLIRRVTFDLTGLPPAPADIEAFLADESPSAFSRVVDRLLASPHYGERWGRHWLDVVRYADSNGLDENIAHGNAWRFRNYVINSLNADKPWDQFIREQIAGDLFNDENTEEAQRHDRLIATGFLSLGPKVLAEGDETRMQMDIIDEQLDTIGRAMLGLTVGCARCHDHKFDPLAQADYYALAGIFQSTQTMESLKRIARWNENSIATAADKERLELHKAAIETRKAEIAALLSSAVAAASDATSTASDGKASPKPVPEEKLPEDVRMRLAEMRADLKQLEATIPELPTAMGVTDSRPINGQILMRGNHLTPGRTVDRGIPVVFSRGDFPRIDGTSGRREFSEWLTSPENPLTARVIVNRVWRWHFGRGIVGTTDNFGHLGERPTNPELLDWLAADFMQNGWSLKALHRTILLSSVWQQSSDLNPAARRKDPDNLLLARFPIHRLEAESVRDSILAVSGLLDPTQGESMLHVRNREFLFDHTSKDLTSYASFRRSVYLPVIRNNLYDAMSLFDCTDGTVPNGDRASSTVASQALFLMNSDLVMEAAEHLSAELRSSFPNDVSQQIRTLMIRTTGRPIQDAELQAMLHTMDAVARQLESDNPDHEQRNQLSLAAVCHSLLMSNEFLYVR